MIRFPYGFRMVGDCRKKRRLTSWAGAFLAHCACDTKAEVAKESYLSAFTFGEEFRCLLEETGSTRGYAGACSSPWLWFDIDREQDLQCALDDTRVLANVLVERYAIEGNALLVFYSGSKGFHLGLSTALWSPHESDAFHQVCRRMAERLAELAGVNIDSGVYDRVRAFRAPNSRHPKTGLHKRRLTFDELRNLDLEEILRLAESPMAFDIPEPPELSNVAIADWQAAANAIAEQTAARDHRRHEPGNQPRLNRSTMDFIHHGATPGDRHRLLYSAAANLGEFGCPPELAYALLTEAALDSGLPPTEVKRQIDCGLNSGRTGT